MYRAKESIVTKFAAGYHRPKVLATSLPSLEEQMAFVALQDDSPLLSPRHQSTSSSNGGIGKTLLDEDEAVL